MQLPRLTARNHSEAVAILRERRNLLLQEAGHLLDRAELFTDSPAAFDQIVGEVRRLLAEAERHRIAA